MERGEGEGKKIGDSKEGWRSGVTRGHDRNRNSVHGRGAEGRKRSFYSCLYAAPLKYRLCNWRAPYPGEDISTALNVCARTPSNAPQCALPQDFHPCQTYATSVFSIYGSTLSLLLFFFPSPPFSLVEIVSSFSFPRFRFRFLQQTTRKNENRSNWRLKMLEKEKISTR